MLNLHACAVDGLLLLDKVGHKKMTSTDEVFCDRSHDVPSTDGTKVFAVKCYRSILLDDTSPNGDGRDNSHAELFRASAILCELKRDVRHHHRKIHKCGRCKECRDMRIFGGSGTRKHGCGSTIAKLRAYAFVHDDEIQ